MGALRMNRRPRRAGIMRHTRLFDGIKTGDMHIMHIFPRS
ncbi:hypothetical protein Ga0061061_11089 [Chelatococcus sambhunathii]|uniref:Uncharacterized protein n=1 Tax=Chelatococcus sambhunathii TaxID=363953 RepID=A0ABP2AAV9_9HYPH|nr:hypothetical protein Ga0061061_11089 [Chelatococcus sambhunathii]